MIIDNTCFTANNISLPVDELGTILTGYITKYEPEILTRLLGYELYKEFNSGLSETTPLAKWTNLRDGAVYTYNGLSDNFTGLSKLICNYVFYKFSRENQSYSTSIGTKRINSENGEKTDPSIKQSIAWNEVSDINQELYKFISGTNTETADTYENYIYGIFEKITKYGF